MAQPSKAQMVQQLKSGMRYQDIEFLALLHHLTFQCDLRFSSILIPLHFYLEIVRKKFVLVHMLLTHPLTHMGRVSMLTAHLCALLLQHLVEHVYTMLNR